MKLTPSGLLLRQVPGVIVMEIMSDDSGTADPQHRRIVTVFNAAVTAFTGDSILLVPIQRLHKQESSFNGLVA